MTNGLAVKYGKRPMFLAANVLLFATSIWAFYTQSWNALLASRLIGSCGLAPYETLVSATVSDVYGHQYLTEVTVDTLYIKEANESLLGGWLYPSELQHQVSSQDTLLRNLDGK